MNTCTQVVRYGDFSATIETPELLKTEALAESALIGKVTNAEENEILIKALQMLDGALKPVEDARVQLKKPHITMGRKIDALAKEWSAPLVEERNRLRQLGAEFAALDKARLKAAEAARMEELSAIDRRRQDEIKEAKTLDEIDEIQERYNEEAKLLPPLPQPTRADGQRVTSGWDITVVDMLLLDRCHPNCVKRTALLTEIGFLLDNDIKVAGVIAKRKEVLSVSAPKNSIITI